MSGAAAAASGRGGSFHLIGIGGTDPYGFAAGLVGSCTPNTFRSVSGVQTIDGLLYNGGTGQLFFRLNGAAVADSDSSFVGIVLAGVFYKRTAGTRSLPGVYTQWHWNVGSNVVGTSGSIALVVMR